MGRRFAMETMNLDAFEDVREIVRTVQLLDDPIVVKDGEDECLVAMRPSVFEHILFDDAALGLGGAGVLHY